MNASKVSFCTTCMGRLHHLRETLPKNIEDNYDYCNTEFVILDYNSNDNLDRWIRENFAEQINVGKIVYAKVSGPTYFHRSHAKNVAAKCSSGDIICNLDADNFTGKSFASYINEVFSTYEKIFLNTDIQRSPKDVCGRIVLKRNDFFAIGGYDEDMKGWGYEDADLKEKLTRKGLRYLPIDTPYLQFLTHDDSERMRYEENFQKIEHVWVKHLGKSETEIIYLFEDGTFQSGTVRRGRIDEPYAFWVLKEDEWTEGNFIMTNVGQTNHEVVLIGEQGLTVGRLICSSCQRAKTTTSTIFYQALSGIELEMAKHTYSIVSNYSIMKKNQRSSQFRKDLLANDKVFINFSKSPTLV